LRLRQTPVASSVKIGGIDRLRILAGVARHATEMQVYSSEDGATAWCVESPDSRLFIVLSPEPSRGFSGEGQVLQALAEQPGITARLRALLRWQNSLDAKLLANELGASETTTAAALAELGACGLVGFDLAQGTYFHRELPFDVMRIEKLHRRLANARKLATAGDVERDADGMGAWVRGKDGEYRVRRDADGQWHCLCPWQSRYRNSRGPCRHILAVKISGGEVVDA